MRRCLFVGILLLDVLIIILALWMTHYHSQHHLGLSKDTEEISTVEKCGYHAGLITCRIVKVKQKVPTIANG